MKQLHHDGWLHHLARHATVRGALPCTLSALSPSLERRQHDALPWVRSGQLAPSRQCTAIV